MVWKDAESVFQRGFHGRRRCRIIRSLITTAKGQICVYTTPKYGTKPMWYVTLFISARRSFSLSQKSRCHNRRYVLTKALSGRIFVALQNPYSLLWCQHSLRFVDSDSNQCLYQRLIYLSAWVFIAKVLYTLLITWPSKAREGLTVCRARQYLILNSVKALCRPL